MFLFFFRQSTAYEMRISDWSSDVCSSDLQVPAAALHLDAVRLMTVHGSKGLEFEAVHVPGLTKSSFPASNRGQRCPPPIGMIEGAQALSVSDEAKRAHEHEEECL